MSGRFYSPGLMDIDMTAVCAEHSLKWTQNRRNYCKIRLGSSHQKMNICLRCFTHLLNCFSRFFTVRIFPISYCLLHIGLNKLLDNSRMCPFCVIASKQNHFNIPSTFSFNSFVACSISGCPKTALITATPQIPFPASSVTFSSVIPPIATTGMSTVSQISFKTL